MEVEVGRATEKNWRMRILTSPTEREAVGGERCRKMWNVNGRRRYGRAMAMENGPKIGGEHSEIKRHTTSIRQQKKIVNLLNLMVVDLS